MMIAITALCLAVLLGVFLLGQRNGRAIEAAFMAKTLRARKYIGGDIGRAYASVANDLRYCEAKAFARIQRYLKRHI